MQYKSNSRNTNDTGLLQMIQA